MAATFSLNSVQGLFYNFRAFLDGGASLSSEDGFLPELPLIVTFGTSVFGSHSWVSGMKGVFQTIIKFDMYVKMMIFFFIRIVNEKSRKTP